MQKLIFHQSQNIPEIFKKYNPQVINFLNSHDLYQFHNNLNFKKTFNEKNFNFVDGFILTLFLSLKKIKRVRRFSGPDFIERFFGSKFMNNKRHLFIGLNKNQIDLFLDKFHYLKRNNLFYYNPPHIKEEKFSPQEIKKISNIINHKKVDFVWDGMGCPKQNILTASLVKNSKAKHYINIGAGLDFIIGRKKRAPKLFRHLGIEWLYRLITDFNHTKKKAWRSFVAFKYLKEIDLQ